jgi:cell division control protein 45
MLADLLTIRYSLQQCQQNYSHMDISLKKELPSKLEAIAPEYGLIELSYPSFTRAFGFQLAQLSAADAVEGLSALLEAAMGVRLEVEKEGGRNGGEWFGGTRMWNLGGGLPSIKSGGGDKENVDPRGANGEVEGTQEKKKEQSWHVQNFWTAYDAIEE